MGRAGHSSGENGLSVERDPARTGLAQVMLWLASAALAVMMLVVVADVVLRIAFGIPVRGAYDVVSMGLLVMVFFGIAPVVARAGEITIDLIDHLLPRPVLVFLQLVASGGGLLLFLFLGWSMIGPARDTYRWGGYSLELGVPVWWQWAAAFVGLGGIVWISAWRALRDAKRLIAGARCGSEDGTP